MHHNNKRIKIFTYFLLAALTIGQSFGQKQYSEERNSIIEKRIEYTLENSNADEADYLILFDNLNYYYDHPLNLNKAGVEDLQSLGLLNDIQILDLIKHREKFGPLMTLEELQVIPSFDRQTIEMILPFVKIGREKDDLHITPREIVKNGKHVYFIRSQRILETQKGYTPANDSLLQANPNARYLGSPWRIYNRYRFTYLNRISIGFTAEKDAGEEFFKGSQPQGFDFYSGHFFLKNIGKIKQLAIGDYVAQYGQAVTLWSGYAFGLGADIFTVKRNASGILPYTSVDENVFQRGAAICIEPLKHLQISALYSKNHIDANITYDSTEAISADDFSFTSFITSGYHRLPRELEDKGKIKREIYASHIAWKTQRADIGITGMHARFDKNFKPSQKLYNQFYLDTNAFTNIGVDYNFTVRNFNFFGETSYGLNGGLASVNGVLMMLDPKVSLIIHHRYYSVDYWSVYNNGVGVNTNNNNEQGLYLGAKFYFSRKWTAIAYTNSYSFPWLRYNTMQPTSGFENLVQLTYKPDKKLETYVRYRYRLRQENSSSEQPIKIAVNKVQTNLRYDLSYKISDRYRIKSRIEWVHVTKTNEYDENGYLIYQDLIYKPLSSKWSYTLRYALFDTPGYNSRIYAYENDVLYSFSIPAYYYKGNRAYLMIQYSPNNKIDLWVRIGQFFYYNRNVIGSGLDEIQGNTKTDLKIQLRISL